MEILAIIPARGGSKGIKNKNMTDLCGQPLLKYTFDAAKGSRLITRAILSTDSEEYAAYGRENGIEVCMRPAEFAKDRTPMNQVIEYHLKDLKEKGYEPDIFILLQPTSPLRTPEHIDEALQNLIDDSKADATVSAKEMPHECLPMKIMKLDDDGSLSFYQEGGEKYTTRQTLPTLYARNGAAIYALYTKAYFNTKGLYGSRCIPYIMKEEDSVDIDTPFDLFIAECILKKRMG